MKLPSKAYTFFNNNFYIKYPIMNFDDILEFCDQRQPNDNTNSWGWGTECKIERCVIPSDDISQLLWPSINFFASEFMPCQVKLCNPWINFYKRGYYQETHDHHEEDFAAVMFLNDGDDFGEFYFQDRNNLSFSKQAKKFLGYGNVLRPGCKAGEIIFFPAHMMHGVTTHESDTVRKTIAFNFNILASPETT
tara:strand:+ start:4384 stop:4959 length:576 start_codon:yes stop_codon:yes gene_type:complete